MPTEPFLTRRSRGRRYLARQRKENRRSTASFVVPVGEPPPLDRSEDSLLALEFRLVHTITPIKASFGLNITCRQAFVMLHKPPELVAHPPRGLICDTELSLKLFCRDAILRGREKKDGMEPEL